MSLANPLSALTPINLAISILIYSIVTAFLIFKASLSSWLPFVLIIIFSSGMITLFIYVASLNPNENSNSNNPFWIFPVLLLSINSYFLPSKGSADSINSFSSWALIGLMAAILILAMLSISLQSFSPSQSISSTF